MMAESTQTEAALQDRGAQAQAEPPRAGKRRALEQVATSASSLLVMAIVLMVNYLAFRHYARVDWTSQGMFTLSQKSLKVLHGLDKDVDLYLFMSRAEPNFEHTEELIRRYKAATDKLKVHFVDPDREPGEFKVLAQRFGVGEGMTGTGEVLADVAAVVTRGEKRWHVNRDDLLGWDMGGPGGQEEELNVKAEQALTGAIVQVVSGSPTRVCVTKGHGEWSLDESDERSLSSLKLGLRHDNIEWEAFETLGKKEVPKNCNAVFVIGPTRAFSEPESKLILDYVHAGGNALLALDPVIEHDQIAPTGFENGLKSVGVRLDSALAIELDPEHRGSPSPVEFFVTDFGDHETTRPLKDRARIVVALARGMSVLEKTDKIEPLIRTSAKGFGATDVSRVMATEGEPTRGPGDIGGPVDLALAVRVQAAPDELQPKPGGRLVVVGDSDFLQSALLEAPELANFHLASAWTGWLTAREALIEIPPKKAKGGSIVFTQDDLTALLFRVAVLLPGAALLFGVAVWFNRRA